MMVRPAMPYEMEAVTVTKRQKSKMEVAEMKMLRFSLGKQEWIKPGMKTSERPWVGMNSAEN